MGAPNEAKFFAPPNTCDHVLEILRSRGLLIETIQTKGVRIHKLRDPNYSDPTAWTVLSDHPSGTEMEIGMLWLPEQSKDKTLGPWEVALQIQTDLLRAGARPTEKTVYPLGTLPDRGPRPITKTAYWPTLLIAGFAACAALIWSIFGDPIPQSKWDRIQLGMTKDQVRAILGEPKRLDGENQFEYGGPLNIGVAEFDFDYNGRLVDKNDESVFGSLSY